MTPTSWRRLHSSFRHSILQIFSHRWDWHGFDGILVTWIRDLEKAKATHRCRSARRHDHGGALLGCQASTASSALIGWTLQRHEASGEASRQRSLRVSECEAGPAKEPMAKRAARAALLSRGGRVRSLAFCRCFAVTSRLGKDSMPSLA